MKKLIGIITLFSVNCFGAVAVTSQWELRTTGNDNNGGFFNGAGSNPGTDFSQQNAAQYTFADLASTNATTTCVVTSASHNFVAADVRNGLHISAGTSWTVGWYEIISVAANAATLDRACGSVASVTAGTYFVGGGLLTWTGLSTATNTSGASPAVGFGTANIQAGTYTTTATITFNNSGFFVGYSVTHADNGTPPLLTTATNSIDLIRTGGSSPSFYFDNISFSTTAATPSVGYRPFGSNNPYAGFRNCIFSGFTNAINGDNVTGFLIGDLDLIGVEIKNTTSSGVVNNSSGTTNCNGCWIHNNTGIGIGDNSHQGDLLLVNSIISNNGGVGINTGLNLTRCINSDIVSNTGDGIFVNTLNGSTSTRPVLFSDSCIIYGNGGFGINVNGSPTNSTIGRNNAFGANVSGPRNNINATLSDIALTANPFTTATNFALNATAGGGAAINTQGYPGIFPTSATTSTTAIGAVQASSGGSGGSSQQTVIYIK